jgi:hypothetical protein
VGVDRGHSTVVGNRLFVPAYLVVCSFQSSNLITDGKNHQLKFLTAAAALGTTAAVTATSCWTAENAAWTKYSATA